MVQDDVGGASGDFSMEFSFYDFDWDSPSTALYTTAYATSMVLSQLEARYLLSTMLLSKYLPAMPLIVMNPLLSCSSCYCPWWSVIFKSTATYTSPSNASPLFGPVKIHP
jgi:hypothetical protein